MRRTILFLLLAFNLTAGSWLAWVFAGQYPENLPWTPLDLEAPIGWATASKLAALQDSPAGCYRLLRESGMIFTVPTSGVPPAPACATDGAIRTRDIGLTLAPRRHLLACPLAAALIIWNRQVVVPAARLHLGREARGLQSLGSWNCRSIAGSGRYSEHATANAIDISAIDIGGVSGRTGSGKASANRSRRIRIAGEWNDATSRADFLRAIRDGGCRLFRVVLSPDYNAAHADHLHLDMGPGRTCS